MSDEKFLEGHLQVPLPRGEVSDLQYRWRTLEEGEFLRRAKEEIRETRDNLTEQAAVRRRLKQEIEATRQKREVEIEDLCLKDPDRIRKMLESVRLLAIEGKYKVTWMARTREMERESARAGEDVGKRGEVYERYREGGKLLEQAQADNIVNMRHDLAVWWRQVVRSVRPVELENELPRHLGLKEAWYLR
jgi:hypothetical protein